MDTTEDGYIKNGRVFFCPSVGLYDYDDATGYGWANSNWVRPSYEYRSPTSSCNQLPLVPPSWKYKDYIAGGSRSGAALVFDSLSSLKQHPGGLNILLGEGSVHRVSVITMPDPVSDRNTKNDWLVTNIDNQ